MPVETIIRLGSFAAVLAVMSWLESVFPRRALTAPRLRRSLNNLGMAAFSTFVARIIFPMLPVTVAFYCQKNAVGLFHLFDMPYWLSFASTIVLLDMAVWFQHLVFHKYLILWRIHRMHHADVDIDASTGVRFHPMEIVISFAYKICLIFLFGTPPEAVVAFEVLLNCCAVFNHANVRIPVSLDAWLRLLIVTPDMHRVHHSTDMREASTNYGFNFPWWDRLFGTYTAQPKLGHDGMKIGLNIFRDSRYISAIQMLAIPFR